MSALFRPEAGQRSVRRVEGAVILASPLSFRLLTGVAVVAVVAALLFASLATYARKVTVDGWLSPGGGLIRVVARDGGVVQTLYVREGDKVDKGQALASLRLSTDGLDGNMGQAFNRGLEREVDAAAVRVEATRRRAATEAEQTRRRIEVLSRELIESEGRIRLARERSNLARAEVQRAENLATQGYLPRRELDARRTAALSAETEISQNRTGALQLQRELDEARARLETLQTDLQIANADSEAVSATLAQRRADATGRDVIVLTAPVSGNVAAMPINLGQTLAPGAAAAIVTPAHSVLEAELYIPSSAIGFVRVGQPVQLAYQAFPYEKFGRRSGRVVSVSNAVLAPTDVAIPGVEIREPVYRVRVKLDEASIKAYGENIPLRAGMLLSADIVADRRSLLEWLLDPLYAAGRRT